MALQSGLMLAAYTLPGIGAPTSRLIGPELAGISFTTVAPGGCGDLSAVIKLKDARLPASALDTFARVAVQSSRAPLGMSHFTVYQGEISDATVELTDTDGEVVTLNALGVGVVMRDDPRADSYTGQTIAQMAAQQLSSRSAYLGLDQDTVGVVPRTASTFSPQYANNNMEEVIANLALIDGDDMWGVWPHNTNRDAVSLPTAQLLLHARDAATTHYTAQQGTDILKFRVIKSAERAYNVVKIGYNDPGQSPPVGFAYAIDTRVASSGSTITGQGTAPFRPRVFYRDYSGVATVTQAIAQSIANQYLTLFQNVTNRIEVTLKGLRDASGNPVPLWTAWADHNIGFPALTVRGVPLSATLIPGVNQYYIVETRYEERDGEMGLTLQCDNFVDTVAQQVARLQLQADTQLRQGQRTTGAVQALGAPLKAHFGMISQASAGAQNFGAGVNYGVTLTQLPTSTVLSATVTTNATGTGVTASDYYGCTVTWSSSASGKTELEGTVQTVGN